MRVLFLVVGLLFVVLASGQGTPDSSVIALKDSTAEEGKERIEKVKINGYIVTAMISGDDTLIIADLEEASVTSLHDFGSRDEYNRYRKYRRYATKVYPYAVEAIKIFNEMEESTVDMSKKKRRKHIRKLNKKLKKEFKDPLKKLSKTQGLILTKMIERHLDKSMHTLIKDSRGGFNAFYWHNLGKLNGYDLKHKYTHGEDRIMDIVLQDFDISRDEVRSTDYLKSGVISEREDHESNVVDTQVVRTVNKSQE